MPGMNKGVQRALLAALFFGISAPIAKVLVGNVPPQFLAGLRYLGSGTGLLLVRWFRRKPAPQPQAQMSRADLPYFAGAIAAGGVFAPILLMYGLLRTPAGSSALLLNLEAVFTTNDLSVGAAVMQGTRIGWLGQTGNALGQPSRETHVHFEVRHNGSPVNPGAFLNGACPW
jgi:drug/metabolite transporter (DMT)-like permease